MASPVEATAYGRMGVRAAGSDAPALACLAVAALPAWFTVRPALRHVQRLCLFTPIALPCLLISLTCVLIPKPYRSRPGRCWLSNAWQQCC